MTAPLPLCVIGAGLIGLRHIEVAMASDRIRLTAVVESHAPTRDRLARQGLPTCARLDDLPTETRAAVIATPTPTHRALALDCLGRGLAVLAEKPLAGTLDDARAMIAAAEAQGLPLVTGHHRRCHPFSTAARDALMLYVRRGVQQGAASLGIARDKYVFIYRALGAGSPHNAC